MKIAVLIVRSLVGLLFTVVSIMVLAGAGPKEEMTGNAKLFNEGLQAAGYFFPLLKTTELVCGIAFLIGRFVPLAAVVIFPIIINILCYHAFVDKAVPGIITGFILLASDLFIAYAYRKSYESLLRAKAPIG